MRTGNIFIARCICAALLSLLPGVVLAQTLTITPEVITSSSSVERALQENKGRAKTSLEGQGGTLRLTYQASEPITIYMVPITEDGRYIQSDFIVMTLPATEKAIADIDLTVSPGWSPTTKTWLLHVLTKDQNAEAGFSSIEFVPVNLTKTVATVFRHALSAESYSPSSYHGLHGYRIISLSFTMIVGIALLLAGASALFFAKKPRKLQTLVIVIIAFHALYGLRFGVDLLRFTGEHLSGYAHGAYDEAGSIYQVAEALTELTANSEKKTIVFACRSGTDYKEKILRYMTYPITVTADSSVMATADFALAMDTDTWTYDSVSELLHCGTLTVPVRKISDFPDGSILFTILR